MNVTNTHAPEYDVARIMGGIYGDGMIGLKGALERHRVEELREDIEAAYRDALSREGGAVGRGPNRHYVEIRPEDARGFVALTTHPWVTAVCEAVLGPSYVFVEIGFDVPNPGAMNQPWHRDFPAPPETLEGRRISSLAFNVTTVDVTDDMGPFEIAVGTQWDDPSGFDYAMFPPKSEYPRYAERAQRKLPQMGDIAVRTGLAIHRGTANRSTTPRPVLVLGAEAGPATSSVIHDLQMTHDFFDGLPDSLQAHLAPRLVSELEPVVQGHTIEGLVMGEA
ncbi:MAG TPA: phytanoyl-CoA dioxygenase family protein [Gaiellaceae bacterium]|nr:phytanoyl-CoA dioxygenase family protein [Gaiellaceae bacterium]